MFAQIYEKRLLDFPCCPTIRYRAAWNSSAATGRISLKFFIGDVYEYQLRKFIFFNNNRSMNLYEGLCTFLMLRLTFVAHQYRETHLI